MNEGIESKTIERNKPHTLADSTIDSRDTGLADEDDILIVPAPNPKPITVITINSDDEFEQTVEKHNDITVKMEVDDSSKTIDLDSKYENDSEECQTIVREMEKDIEKAKQVPQTTQMEILELEMRARAIKAMIKVAEELEQLRAAGVDAKTVSKLTEMAVATTDPQQKTTLPPLSENALSGSRSGVKTIVEHKRNSSLKREKSKINRQERRNVAKRVPHKSSSSGKKTYSQSVLPPLTKRTVAAAQAVYLRKFPPKGLPADILALQATDSSESSDGESEELRKKNDEKRRQLLLMETNVRQIEQPEREINTEYLSQATNRKLINPEAEKISEEEGEEDLVEENDEYEGFVSESEDEFGQPRENELPKVRSAVLIRNKVPWEHRRLRKMFDRRCMFPIRPRPEFKEIEENNETEDASERVEVTDLRDRINRNIIEKTKEISSREDRSRTSDEKTTEQDVHVKKETKDLEDELDFEEELLGDFDFTKMSETQSVD